ncbi:MAG: MBL fold metallo-hydrolase [Thiotrichales bacterium]
MALELYNKGNHVCVVFSDLVVGEAVQANQFLIADHDHAALIDPGGELTYTRLYMALGNYVAARKLDFVIASHQDPDIVASLNRWLVGTDCKAVVPQLWERFIPHFTAVGKTKGRLISIPDAGMNLQIGNISLAALPAHFLHAEGNFHFYDPVSKILFSGDMGANLASGDLEKPFKKLSEAIPYMEGFHRRYMNSRKVTLYWANMIRQLDIDWMVPQHGRPFKGKKVIAEFLDWIAMLECGVDLMTQDNYRLPGKL